MIAGPYGTGARSEQARRLNLQALNEVALAVFRLGHVPVLGVNMALPLIALAGDHGDAEVMMPLSLALAERCDAVLRVGGPSVGADQEVARIRARGGAVFTQLDQIPRAGQGATSSGPGSDA